MAAKATIEELVKNHGCKPDDPRVAKLVKVTNELREIWSTLLLEADTRNGSKKHLKLLKRENTLHSIQKKLGQDLNVFARDSK